MSNPRGIRASRELGIPPAIIPPEKPLRARDLVLALLRNPLSALSVDLYQKPMVVYAGLGMTTAFVMAPDLIRVMFHEKAASFDKNPLDRRIMGRALGNGVLIAPEEDWRWQRRTVAPLFRQGEIAHSVPVISAAARRLLERWRAEAPAVADVGRAMGDLTFDIINGTMFAGGASFDARGVKDAIEAYLAPITWEIAYDFARVPAWVPHPGTRRMSRSAVRARREVAKLVAERRSSGDADDLLGRLIAARDEDGSSMSDEQIVDNLLTFLTAGHETTARALAWSLYVVAFLPGWRDLLAAEVARVVGDRSIEGHDVERLPLLQRFIKESMRLFPSAPAISRIVRESVTLGDENLPEGTRVFIPIYVIHRHRTLWPEPDVFNPDRFLPEAEAVRHRYAYLPFGAGQRTCIGAGFAMMEATVILATLVRGLRFETIEDDIPEPVTRITLTPRRPLLLKVTASETS